MPARSAKSAPAKKTSPVVPPVQHELTPAAAYDFFVPATAQLTDDEILVCRLDLPLALHNVQLGVESIRPFAERLSKELPAIELGALYGLPNLAAATIYAADRVSGPVTKVELAEKLSRVRRLRESMLLIAEGLAVLGLLPGARVAGIRAGNGAVDSARDAVALEALYRENAVALAGKHPFGEADLQEAAELGSFLLRAIVPQGGRQRAEVDSDAVRNRDALYTLLVRGHGELRKVGFYLFGEEVNEYVPVLAGRVVRGKKEEDEGNEPGPAAV